MNSQKLIKAGHDFIKSLSILIIALFVSLIIRYGVFLALGLLSNSNRDELMNSETPILLCIFSFVLLAVLLYYVEKTKVLVKSILPIAIFFIFFIPFLNSLIPKVLKQQEYFVDIGTRNHDFTNFDSLAAEDARSDPDNSSYYGPKMYYRNYCYYNCDCVKEIIKRNPTNNGDKEAFIGNTFYSNKEAIFEGLSSFYEDNCCGKKEGKFNNTFLGKILFFPGLIFEKFYYYLFDCVGPFILISIVIAWQLSRIIILAPLSKIQLETLDNLGEKYGYRRKDFEQELIDVGLPIDFFKKHAQISSENPNLFQKFPTYIASVSYTWLNKFDFKSVLIITILLIVFMGLFNIIYLFQIGIL
jgi:hypothetical protein